MNLVAIPRINVFCNPVASACFSAIPLVLVWKCLTSSASMMGVGLWQGHHIRPQMHDQSPDEPLS